MDLSSVFLKTTSKSTSWKTEYATLHVHLNIDDILVSKKYKALYIHTNISPKPEGTENPHPFTTPNLPEEKKHTPQASSSAHLCS